jgi:hypothetical protein
MTHENLLIPRLQPSIPIQAPPAMFILLRFYLIDNNWSLPGGRTGFSGNSPSRCGGFSVYDQLDHSTIAGDHNHANPFVSSIAPGVG